MVPVVDVVISDTAVLNLDVPLWIITKMLITFDLITRYLDWLHFVKIFCYDVNIVLWLKINIKEIKTQFIITYHCLYHLWNLYFYKHHYFHPFSIVFITNSLNYAKQIQNMSIEWCDDCRYFFFFRWWRLWWWCCSVVVAVVYAKLN